MDIYVVKQGDSVDSIAKSYNISAETILWDNQIEYPYRLAVGQAQTVDKAQGSRLGFFVKRAIKLPFFRIL